MGKIGSQTAHTIHTHLECAKRRGKIESREKMRSHFFFLYWNDEVNQIRNANETAHFFGFFLCGCQKLNL